MLVDELDELSQGIVHVFCAVEELEHFHKCLPQRKTFEVAVRIHLRKGQDGETLGQGQHHGLHVLAAGNPNIVEGGAVLFVKVGAAVLVILFVHGFCDQRKTLNRFLDGAEVAHRVGRHHQIVQGLQDVDAANLRIGADFFTDIVRHDDGVEALMHQIAHQFLLAAEGGLQVYVTIGGLKIRKEGHVEMGPIQAQIQIPGVVLLQGGHQVGIIFFHGQRLFVENLTLVGELAALVGSIEQLAVEFALQLGNVLAHGCLCNSALIGGLGEIPGVGRCQKIV